MTKVKERSITAQSKSILPPQAKVTDYINIGFRHYHAMCRLCHGAPGYVQNEIAKGFYPKPPEYKSNNVQRWGNPELYWIIENGIKMTGMPAFGPTHSEDELWEMVAFMKRLPNLKSEEYAAMVKSAPPHEKDDYYHGHK